MCTGTVFEHYRLRARVDTGTKALYPNTVRTPQCEHCLGNKHPRVSVLSKGFSLRVKHALKKARVTESAFLTRVFLLP